MPVVHGDLGHCKAHTRSLALTTLQSSGLRNPLPSTIGKLICSLLLLCPDFSPRFNRPILRSASNYCPFLRLVSLLDLLLCEILMVA